MLPRRPCSDPAAGYALWPEWQQHIPVHSLGSSPKAVAWLPTMHGDADNGINQNSPSDRTSWMLRNPSPTR
jgi:hypothetical protein